MEDKKIARHAIRESAKGCTGGCITHFLIAIAAAILLGSSAHYWGLSGRAVFLVVLIAIFLASALIPWEKEKRP
jgi:MFS-type transporter involved in bile tolerance (Atg22 family)